jgi:hypothetical protein
VWSFRNCISVSTILNHFLMCVCEV